MAAVILATGNNRDIEQMIHKIEVEIGKDLQFIRINGAAIAGLVDLLIYTMSLLFKL